MWKLNEIIAILAPIIEFIAFCFLDRASKLQINGMQTGLIRRRDKYERDGEHVYKVGYVKKYKQYQRIGYLLIYIGCIFWVLSVILDHYTY